MMIERMSEFPTLTIIRHPLVQHKLTILRDSETPTKIFKELVDEIAMLMAYEATIDLTLEPMPVTTPLEATTGWHIGGKKLTLVPILRAGLGMVEGILRLVVRDDGAHRPYSLRGCFSAKRLAPEPTSLHEAGVWRRLTRE